MMPLQNRVDPFGDIHAVGARGTFTGNRGVIHDPRARTLLRKRWSTRAWIVCACDYKGRRRDVMGRNTPSGNAGWTELFFLDEVTALAAGHRPCFFCRYRQAKAFAGHFGEAFGIARPRVADMDERLHRERLASRNIGSGGSDLHGQTAPSPSRAPPEPPLPLAAGAKIDAEVSAILAPLKGGPKDGRDQRLAPVGWHAKRDCEGMPRAETLPPGCMLHYGQSAYALHKGRALPWSFDGYGEPVDLASLDMANMHILTPATTIAVLQAGYAPVWHSSAK